MEHELSQRASKMKDNFIRATLLLIFLFANPLFAQKKSPSSDNRPNIIFILTDDQRWDQLGVVQREQGENARFPFLETPRLDALAREGMRFRNAFVTTSLCSPSRSAGCSDVFTVYTSVGGSGGERLVRCRLDQMRSWVGRQQTTRRDPVHLAG